MSGYMLCFWIVVSVFASIGVGVVVFICSLLINEVQRSIRQGIRVSTVVARKYRGERRPTFKQAAYAIRREFGRSYSSLIIGFIEIPHNPSEPMRPRFPG